MPPSAKASDLLSWYDAHAREMPWRVAPQDRKNGQIPDPYRIWLSEIMLQQTTVAAVKKYFQRFTQLWPTIGDLAAANAMSSIRSAKPERSKEDGSIAAAAAAPAATPSSLLLS